MKHRWTSVTPFSLLGTLFVLGSSCQSDSSTGRPADYVELSISSPVEGGTISSFTTTFTGACDSRFPVTATTDSQLTYIISATCSNNVLAIEVKLRGLTGSRKISVANAFESVTRTATYTLTCPTGYVPVRGSETYATYDFCVAKYEMKNVNGKAASVSSGTPWVSIERGPRATTLPTAVKACSDLGSQYHLISNNEWMTIARDIESNPANWSGSAVGVGMLARGHSDSSPGILLAASSDSSPYSGTGNDASQAPGSGWEQRRTHTLTGGAIVWDFSGNASEWVSDDIPADLSPSPSLATVAAWKEFSDQTYFGAGSLNRDFFGPLGDYGLAQGVGMAFGASGGSGTSYPGGMVRGGSANANTYAGVFEVYLDVIPTYISIGFSFRCVMSDDT